MIKLFVSSTFADMHAERDAIQLKVLPLLRKKAQEYGEDIDICDLRWGINTTKEDAEEDKYEASMQKILMHCLQSIKNCYPYMVVLLGDRYGTIPDVKILDNATQKFHFVTDNHNKSVTCLEIEYGALNGTETKANALFMFRTMDTSTSTKPLPAHFTAEADYIDSENGERIAPKELLDGLKNKILSQAPDRVQNYTASWNDGDINLDDFIEKLSNKLDEILRPRWEENNLLSPQERRAKRQWYELNRKAGNCVGMDRFAKLCYQSLGNPNSHVCVCGLAGSGRSSILAKAAKMAQENGFAVLPYLLPAEDGGYHKESVFKEWAWHIEELIGAEHQEDASEHFLDLLKKYAATSERPLLLVYDYDKNEEVYNLFQLIEKLKNVHFMYTLQYEFQEETYSSLNTTYITLTNAYTDGIKIVESIFQAMDKSFSADVEKNLYEKIRGKRALYISLLAQRLSLLDSEDLIDFTVPGKIVKTDSQQQDRTFTKLLSELPNDEKGLIYELVDVASRRIGKHFIEDMLSVMVLSQKGDFSVEGKSGVRRADLAHFFAQTGREWKELDFNTMLYYLPNLFVTQENGKVFFANKLIYEAVKERLSGAAFIKEIYQYLQALPKDSLLFAEAIAWYAYLNDDKAYLMEVINLDRWRYSNDLLKAMMGYCYDFDKWFTEILTNAEAFNVGENYVRFITYDLYAYAGSQKYDAMRYQRFFNAALPSAKKLVKNDDFEQIFENCRLFYVTNAVRIEATEEKLKNLEKTITDSAEDCLKFIQAGNDFVQLKKYALYSTEKGYMFSYLMKIISALNLFKAKHGQSAEFDRCSRYGEYSVILANVAYRIEEYLREYDYDEADEALEEAGEELMKEAFFALENLSFIPVSRSQDVALIIRNHCADGQVSAEGLLEDYAKKVRIIEYLKKLDANHYVTEAIVSWYLSFLQQENFTAKKGLLDCVYQDLTLSKASALRRIEDYELYFSVVKRYFETNDFQSALRICTLVEDKLLNELGAYANAKDAFGVNTSLCACLQLKCRIQTALKEYANAIYSAEQALYYYGELKDDVHATFIELLEDIDALAADDLAPLDLLKPVYEKLIALFYDEFLVEVLRERNNLFFFRSQSINLIYGICSCLLTRYEKENEFALGKEIWTAFDALLSSENWLEYKLEYNNYFTETVLSYAECLLGLGQAKEGLQYLVSVKKKYKLCLRECFYGSPQGKQYKSAYYAALSKAYQKNGKPLQGKFYQLLAKWTYKGE